MNDADNATGSRFTWLVSIIGVVFSLVALGLSWQANNLAKEANNIAAQQVNGQLVVLSTETHASIPSQKEQTYNGGGIAVECVTKVRLTNRGGTALSVTDIEATIYHLGKVGVIKSEGPGKDSGTGSEFSRRALFEFGIFSVDDYLSFSTTDIRELSAWSSSNLFPLKIESSSVAEFYVIMDFIAEHAERVYSNDAQDKPGAFEVGYQFTTQAGQYAPSDITKCAYVTLP